MGRNHDRMVDAEIKSNRPPKAKNECAKTRDKDNPYEVYKNAQGWTWRILKKWQVDDAKPYARWFCFVTSPYCPEGEMGDVYVKDITDNAVRVAFTPPSWVEPPTPGLDRRKTRR